MLFRISLKKTISFQYRNMDKNPSDESKNLHYNFQFHLYTGDNQSFIKEKIFKNSYFSLDLKFISVY